MTRKKVTITGNQTAFVVSMLALAAAVVAVALVMEHSRLGAVESESYPGWMQCPGCLTVHACDPEEASVCGDDHGSFEDQGKGVVR